MNDLSENEKHHHQPNISPQVTMPLQILYLFVCIPGIVGNSLVLLAALFKCVKVTPFTLLLLNLSTADVIMNIMMLPPLFINIHQYEQPSQLATGLLCSVVDQNDPVYSAFIANSITLCYISFVRISSFDSLHCGQKTLLKKRNVILYIIFSWLGGFIMMFPKYFMFSIIPGKGCVPNNYTVYSIHRAIASFTSCIIPLIILTVNFLRTTYKMWTEAHFERSSLIQRRKQITYLLLGLTVAYLLFTAPFVICSLMNASGYFGEDIHEFEKYSRPTVLVGLLTTVSDPIFYALCWRGFREGFRQRLKDYTSRERGSTLGSTNENRYENSPSHIDERSCKKAFCDSSNNRSITLNDG